VPCRPPVRGSRYAPETVGVATETPGEAGADDTGAKAGVGLDVGPDVGVGGGGLAVADGEGRGDGAVDGVADGAGCRGGDDADGTGVAPAT
jgi:hypothetical protein